MKWTPLPELEILRFNDGHGSRFIVEEIGDEVMITVRHSEDSRDAETAVLSRERARELWAALDSCGIWENDR